MKTKIQDSIKIEKDVKIVIDKDNVITIEGKKGKLRKNFNLKTIQLTYDQENKKIIALSEKGSKKEKRLIGSVLAHIKNMIKGVDEKHVYKVKVAHSHFPISVQVKDNILTVKNFFGEKKPRTLKIKQGVDVKLEGDILEISSIDKELAGNVASDIEQLTRRTAYDIRRFQDGCYIINKDGKEIV